MQHSHRMGSKMDLTWKSLFFVHKIIEKGRYQLKTKMGNGVLLTGYYLPSTTDSHQCKSVLSSVFSCPSPVNFSSVVSSAGSPTMSSVHYFSSLSSEFISTSFPSTHQSHLCFIRRLFLTLFQQSQEPRGVGTGGGARGGQLPNIFSMGENAGLPPNNSDNNLYCIHVPLSKCCLCGIHSQCGLRAFFSSVGVSDSQDSQPQTGRYLANYKMIS